MHHVYFATVMIVHSGDLRGWVCFVQYLIGRSTVKVGRAVSQIHIGVCDCVVGVGDGRVRIAQMEVVVLSLSIVESGDEVRDHSTVSLVHSGVCVCAVRLAEACRSRY